MAGLWPFTIASFALGSGSRQQLAGFWRFRRKLDGYFQMFSGFVTLSFRQQQFGQFEARSYLGGVEVNSRDESLASLCRLAKRD